ncbi:hypothetical protein K439DRAFT_194253 [Ramaria rubella]|nr:hypothetical protein K439DRAFT_194253 [Ramaria rubella]
MSRACALRRVLVSTSEMRRRGGAGMATAAGTGTGTETGTGMGPGLRVTNTARTHCESRRVSVCCADFASRVPRLASRVLRCVGSYQHSFLRNAHRPLETNRAPRRAPRGRRDGRPRACDDHPVDQSGARGARGERECEGLRTAAVVLRPLGRGAPAARERAGVRAGTRHGRAEWAAGPNTQPRRRTRRAKGPPRRDRAAVPRARRDVQPAARERAVPLPHAGGGAVRPRGGIAPSLRTRRANPRTPKRALPDPHNPPEHREPPRTPQRQRPAPQAL